MAEEIENTVDLKKLAGGFLDFLDRAAENPPWLEKKKTGKWPEMDIPELELFNREIKLEQTRNEDVIETRFKERRELMEVIVTKRNKRLEAYAKRGRKAVPKEKDKYIVAGRVVDRKTRTGLPNMRVNAFDLDRKYDDRLGSTRTDALGYFRIDYKTEDFKDLGDKTPETYIEVLGNDGEALFTSTKSFIQKADKSEYITAPVDGEKVPDQFSQGKKIKLSIAKRSKVFTKRQRILLKGVGRRLG